MINGSLRQVAMASKIRSLSEKVALLPILKHFPEERTSLRRLFQKSPAFQTLCEDYRDCLTALEHWQAATSTEAPEVVQSYVELLQELEQEVRQYLEDETASRIDRPC